jgi:hypothetical protein
MNGGYKNKKADLERLKIFDDLYLKGIRRSTLKKLIWVLKNAQDEYVKEKYGSWEYFYGGYAKGKNLSFGVFLDDLTAKDVQEWLCKWDVDSKCSARTAYDYLYAVESIRKILFFD